MDLSPPSMIGGFVGLIVLVTMKEMFEMNNVVDNARDDFHELVWIYFRWFNMTLC